ncbi:nucleoside-diphosphate kinase [candidate division WWE3 bacterium CG_4_9_14_0_2_um_filter_35_11]|uniref:Nucleoside diphosphate kinase n=1 Tax=candidate division WWE3 bacterium CG_4_9_14_0_2_um_filter_35_11 TaxID=1975077 RepID=A0A2M8EMR3_UNCKA|nr:MAG: nucleoside-diphosphate kinase [candidate division WWE3 bacterium CG10_big_fil_rev_8_21_14_0_10_35_32]PJC24034.1 MAG: nucleoside-diphosphate kinase [candidate division WWE3 bacterium CG_4_9_14_0_2_um_filter_35_11]
MNQDLEKIRSSLHFERTVVLVKPDGLQRGLIGEVISRFERKGLKLVALKMMQVDDMLLEAHYSHHIDKPFFKSLSDFMKSSPLIAMVLEGLEAVEAIRLLCGTTKARSAEAGSIRGDFGMGYTSNIVHSSDSVESAKEEIVRFFDADELFEYDKTEYLNIYLPEL